MPIYYTIDQQNNHASFQIWLNNILQSTFTLNVALSEISQTILSTSVIVPLATHIQNINQINYWTSIISSVFSLTVVKPTNSKQTYNKTDTTMTGKFVIDTYNFQFDYDSVAGNITIDSHPAHTFTWGGFLFFLRYQRTFIAEITNNY